MLERPQADMFPLPWGLGAAWFGRTVHWAGGLWVVTAVRTWPYAFAELVDADGWRTTAPIARLTTPGRYDYA